MFTFQDLMHHFKTICQLFVHLAVQPAKDKRDFMEQALKGKHLSAQYSPQLADIVALNI